MRSSYLVLFHSVWGRLPPTKIFNFMATRKTCQLKDLRLGQRFEMFFKGRPYQLISYSAGPDFPNDWLAICVKDESVTYLPFPVNPSTTIYPL